MKFGLQERIIAGISALVVISAAWFFLYYSPKTAEIERFKQEIESLRTEIQRSSTDPFLIDTLKKNIEELEASIARNELMVLPVDSIAYVTEVIKEKCLTHNLEITEPVSPDKEALFATGGDSLETGIKMVQVQLGVRGTFFDIGKFIEGFKDFPFLIKTGEIEIATDNDLYPDLQASMIVHVFFR